MTLHLTCAFEIITLPNERVTTLFHNFFLRFVCIAKIGQKAHDTITSRPPVPCISQTATTFNFNFDRARMVYKSTTINKRSDKEWLRF